MEFETIHAQVTTKIIEKFWKQRLGILGSWHLHMSIFGFFYVLGFWLLEIYNTFLLVIGWFIYCALNIIFSIYMKRAKKPHLVIYGLISYQVLFIVQLFARQNIFGEKEASD